jgi:hypothetical protein
MPLSEIVIRQAKPGPKAIKIFDGRGLYLLNRRAFLIAE